MYKKKSKRIVDELPSFLSEMGPRPESVILFKKPSFTENYLGPLFFGATQQYHPTPHKRYAAESHQVQYTVPTQQYVLDDTFWSPEEIEMRKKSRQSESRKASRLIKVRKPRHTYVDSYTQSYTGNMKVFVPDVYPHVLDLGETDPMIVGEMDREIPFFRRKRSSSGTLMIGQMEVVWMSDLWEKKRLKLSYKERMAHGHFFKKFGTVRVFGPKIPASLKITQLATKRKRYSDLDFFPEPEEVKILDKNEYEKEKKKEKENEQEKEKEEGKENVEDETEEAEEIEEEEAIDIEDTETEEEEKSESYFNFYKTSSRLPRSAFNSQTPIYKSQRRSRSQYGDYDDFANHLLKGEDTELEVFEFA